MRLTHYRMLVVSLAAALLISLLGAGWVVEAVRIRADIEITGAELRVAQAAAEADKLSVRPLLPEGMGEPVPLGDYLVTAYCCEEYPHICGGNGVTATGTKPTPGITAAADWGQLPPGSVIYIVGVGIRVIEDSGSAVTGNVLDVAVATHAEALSWTGYGHHEVWLLQRGGEDQ